MPASAQEICAIGISGPTYYQEDARARSQASAMAELARAVEVRVKTDLVLRSEGDSRGVDIRLNETAGFGSDVVLKQAQVREQWIQSGKGDHASRGARHCLHPRLHAGGALSANRD
jgi:outer membrane translocation and assembly module TamA